MASGWRSFRSFIWREDILYTMDWADAIRVVHESVRLGYLDSHPPSSHPSIAYSEPFTKLPIAQLASKSTDTMP